MSSSVPEGWNVSSFGSICTFTGGSAFKECYQGESSGDYPFIKVSDMNLAGNERFILRANNWISESIKSEAKTKLFPTGAVVFAKVGAALLLNRRRMLSRDTAIDNNMMAAIPKYRDGRFIYYLLQDVDLGRIVQSGAVPSVNQAQMEAIPLLHPPLPEQQKIAAILTSVDNVIETTQAQIDKLKDLKTGMMQELLTKGIGHSEFKDSPVGRIPVGWEVYTLEQLCAPDALITYGVLKPGNYVEKGIPLLQIKDLSEGTILPGGLHLIGSELDYEYRRSRVLPNDIVISLVGTIGRLALIPKWLKTPNIHRNLGRIRTENYAFIFQFLHSELAVSQLGLTSAGSSQSALNLSALRQLLVPLPDKHEMNKIVKILESIDQRIKATKTTYTQCSRFKKALMQDLLTGKVRVKVD